MGVSSVRLELRFGRQKVTLRGIAAVEEAQKIVDYLTSHYLGIAQPEQSHTGSGVSKKWSRTIVREVQETMPETLPVAQAAEAQLPHKDLSTNICSGTHG